MGYVIDERVERARQYLGWTMQNQVYVIGERAERLRQYIRGGG